MDMLVVLSCSPPPDELRLAQDHEHICQRLCTLKIEEPSNGNSAGA
jgi:hypothetical protein